MNVCRFRITNTEWKKLLVIRINWRVKFKNDLDVHIYFVCIETVFVNCKPSLKWKYNFRNDLKTNGLLHFVGPTNMISDFVPTVDNCIQRWWCIYKNVVPFLLWDFFGINISQTIAPWDTVFNVAISLNLHKFSMFYQLAWKECVKAYLT